MTAADPGKSSRAAGSRAATVSRRRPGRPRGGVPMADRASLLAAAERCIATHGPDVTMEAMAAEAAVSKPVLYAGVGDKDDVVDALAERFVDRINASVLAAVAEARDPRDGLRRFVAAYLDVIEANRNVYHFVTGGSARPGREQLTRALGLADRSAEPLAEQLAAQRQTAGADPSVALTWAYGVIGMLHFVTLRRLRAPGLDSDDVADHVAELLWAGLRGEPPPPAG